ncbi:MAG: hypothetical protein LKJ45_00580 [Oscillospiraceae bacterium]|nr:hypothetical protein [Oscillospiraceae bacterium]
MSPCEMTLAITALANVISENLSEKELPILAAALTQLGDTITTILARRECLEKENSEENTGQGENRISAQGETKNGSRDSMKTR